LFEGIWKIILVEKEVAAVRHIGRRRRRKSFAAAALRQGQRR
jgi:hypothetical protein